MVNGSFCTFDGEATVKVFSSVNQMKSVSLLKSAATAALRANRQLD